MAVDRVEVDVEGRVMMARLFPKPDDRGRLDHARFILNPRFMLLPGTVLAHE